MGRVGQIMAKRARGFDMEIHYFNRNRLSPELELDAVFHETIESLLPHCEFLSIHCPATPETHHLINAERIQMLPDESVLFSAGLDVFNNEPNIDPRYKELDNTFLLPHIGSATEETRDQMGFRALDNLDAIISDLEPKDRLI
ncbi:Glycerate dehydrogenase [Nymphon striatum]|nr:Glycerate dehydrogenase [Nymphon striatum]